MSDPELVLDILSGILIAIDRIERRFQGIEESDDFVISDEGIDRLDGIAMMLIAIGEQVKRLDGSTEANLEDVYPEIDWKGVKGIRDILSHHYFSADAEIIFDVCQNKIGDLKRVVLLLQTQYNDMRQ
ncbi:MAG: DUF86 domain-containing protein [Caldilineaceae bacterium]|nr:DUF86 domain-containing protein [Caldilineaceae bacterium]